MVTFFQKKKNTLCGVIIVIGSESVEASIVLSAQHEALPEILHTSRELMPIQSATTPADQLRCMRRALHTALLDLEKRGLPLLQTRGKRLHIQKILVSCTAPWSETATQIIRFVQDTPFTVTPQMIDEIIAHAYETEETHTPERTKILADAGKQIVEKTIIDITLNGYSVQHPYGKHASEIAIAHLRGLVPTDTLTVIEDIKKRLHSRINVRVHTSALILYCVLRDLYPRAKNALIVDVSGEATEMLLVQNHILYESVIVPYGMHALILEMASVCKTIPDEARGCLRAYKQNVLTEAQEKVLWQAQNTYVSLLERALAGLSGRYVLPQTIFLLLDQDMEAFFIEVIEQAAHDTGGIAQKTIIPFSPARTHDLVTVQHGGASPRLAFSARFFHTLHACGEIDIHS